MIDGSAIKRVMQVDASGNPIVGGTLLSTTKTLTANNTTASEILFRVTGTVHITKLYGVVTTALSSAVTAAHWRLNDQTAQPVISLATGTTLSSFVVGSLVARRSIASVALSGINANVGQVFDPVAATAPGVFMPFTVTQKSPAVQTDIEFRYTTTNTPASGAIEFFVEWQPLSAGSTITAV